MNNNLNYGYIDLLQVSQRLRLLRENHNFSLEYVSNTLLNNFNIKLSTTAIWKYENNRIKQLNINTIAALSQIYNASQKYILYGDESINVDTTANIAALKIEICQILFKINDINVLNQLVHHVYQLASNSGVDENNFDY